MTPRCLSRLQRHSLKCLMAEYRRPQSGPRLGHYKLVQALGRDKRHVSHSLRTLEARGLIVIRRTPGGQAHSVHLTAAVENWPRNLHKVVNKRQWLNKQLVRE